MIGIRYQAPAKAQFGGFRFFLCVQFLRNSEQQEQGENRELYTAYSYNRKQRAKAIELVGIMSMP
eukprot:3232077-Amphidinium_carterae.1